jgi:hypothetical protein
MTLPFPNSPAITEGIATSIDRIEQNLEYLDDAFVTSTMKLVQKTYDMAVTSGAVAITGVGFQPTAIIAIAGENTGDSQSWGFSDPTPDAMSIFRRYDEGSGHSTGNMVYLLQADGKSQVAAVTSYDSDGATLTWTKTGAPTGNMVITFLFMV